MIKTMLCGAVAVLVATSAVGAADPTIEPAGELGPATSYERAGQNAYGFGFSLEAGYEGLDLSGDLNGTLHGPYVAAKVQAPLSGVFSLIGEIGVTGLVNGDDGLDGTSYQVNQPVLFVDTTPLGKDTNIYPPIQLVKDKDGKVLYSLQPPPPPIQLTTFPDGSVGYTQALPLSLAPPPAAFVQDYVRQVDVRQEVDPASPFAGLGVQAEIGRFTLGVMGTVRYLSGETTVTSGIIGLEPRYGNTLYDFRGQDRDAAPLHLYNANNRPDLPQVVPGFTSVSSDFDAWLYGVKAVATYQATDSLSFGAHVGYATADGDLDVDMVDFGVKAGLKF